MIITRPHGMVERMNDRRRRPDTLQSYGRDKDGSPQNAETLKIAHDSDRREHGRRDERALRGRLIDLNT
jgi:hypothetical protein